MTDRATDRELGTQTLNFHNFKGVLWLKRKEKNIAGIVVLVVAFSWLNGNWT